MMEDPQPIAQAFRQRGYRLAEEGLGDHLLQLAAELSTDAAWLAGHFEVFMSTRAYTKEVHEDLLEEFEEFARQESKRESKLRAREARTPAAKARPGVLADQTNTGTPRLSTGKPQQKSRLQGVLPSPAADAKQGGVVSSLNPHLSFPDKGRPRVQRPELTELGSSVAPSQTFFMDRLQDKVAYLEGSINRFADAVERSEGCSLANSVHLPAQEAQWYVGRICCDSEGRLNESSVLLEGSIRHSQGQRVRLDLSSLPSFRLFPGQCVAVQGTNPTGDRLIALRLVTSLALPPASRLQPAPLLENALDAPTSVVIAAGPFSRPGDLSFGPLQQLLAFCAEARPGLLLLLGPFVDAEHPLIAGGLVERTFEDIFREEVLAPLAEVGEGMTVALLPSTRDAHHWPVFPQPPLEAAAGDLPEGARLLGNPATFACAGVMFGAVTTDVLRHLSCAEAERGAAGDRIAGLASHVTAQGSYYPLFPPALGAMLDSRLAGEGLRLPAAPDVLLLPSDLNAFAKPLDAGVCVNPGRLARGSFAHLQFGGRAEQQAFAQRCRVDIRQL